MLRHRGFVIALVAVAALAGCQLIEGRAVTGSACEVVTDTALVIRNAAGDSVGVVLVPTCARSSP